MCFVLAQCAVNFAYLLNYITNYYICKSIILSHYPCSEPITKVNILTRKEFMLNAFPRNIGRVVAEHLHWFIHVPLNLLEDKKDLDIHTFYITVPRRDRLIKILQRGDEVDEAIRRNQSDVGQFDGIEDEVDYVLENEKYKYTKEQMAKMVVNLLK